MEYVFLGTSGLKVSPLCLGTMNFGGAATTQCSEAEAHAILDAYVAAGGNFIDTADVYQKGESERILGRWLAKNAALRSKLVIASKVRGAVDPSTAGPNDVGLSRSHIMAAVDESLARLGISHIDLYQCHVWDAGTPLAETLRALDDLTKAGKIRYHGWSNVTGYQAMKIMSECARLGLSPPVSISSQYSLLCRQTEWEVLPVCEGEGIAMLPWSPLKGGWLSGKLTRDTSEAPAGSRVAWAQETGSKMQSAPGFSEFANEHTWKVIDTLQEVAAGAGCTVAQAAIKWLLHKRSVASVVVGPKSVSQLNDNLGAARVTLSREAVAKLDAASVIPVPYPYEMVGRLQNGRHHIAADKY